MTAFLAATRPLVVALCAAAFLYQLVRTTRMYRDPAAVALLVATASGVVSWIVTTPVVGRRLQAWTGLVNVSTLIMELLAAAVLSPALLIAVTTWSNPPAAATRKIWRTIGYGLVVGVVMVGLWTVAALGAGKGIDPVGDMSRPAVIAYLVFYLVSFNAGLVMLIRLSLSSARVSPDRWLRRGLISATVGAGCYLFLSLDRLVAVPLQMVTHHPARWEAFNGAASRIGLAGIIIGLMLPSAAAHWAQATRWWRHLRLLHALYPLWRDLHRAFPEVSLFHETIGWRSYLDTDELGYLLRRRVIEIRDCWRALRPYLPPPPPRIADDTDLAAAAANSLRTALASRRNHEPPNEDSGPSTLERLETNDLDEDIAWLVQVGRSYATGGKSVPFPTEFFVPWANGSRRSQTDARGRRARR